jgi:hypothetical protein
MLNNNRDICLALVLLIALFFAIWLEITPLRLILCLPLLFFFPGHLALRAVRITLPPVEHTVAAFGMSLFICIVGCFALYGASYLTPFGWAAWLSTVIGGLSTWIIHRQLPGSFIIERPAVRIWHAAVIVLALMIATGAYWLAIHDEETAPREFAYTEFWLIPTQPGKFVLGIRNQESQPESYDLTVNSHGAVITKLHSIRLNPGERWIREITSNDRTEATLYLRKDSGPPIVYRRVNSPPNLPKELNKPQEVDAR